MLVKYLTQFKIAFFTVTFSVTSVADMYRYRDDNGKWVYTQKVPAEYIKRGYEVLGDDLRFIREVPRAKTKAELEALAEQQAVEEKARAAAEKQKQQDDMLLHRFGSYEEISQARERKMSELKGKVSILQGNLNGIRKKIENLQIKAANMEREGKGVADFILEKMKILRKSEAETQATIALRKQEIEEETRKYHEFAERYKQIKSVAKKAVSAD